MHFNVLLRSNTVFKSYMMPTDKDVLTFNKYKLKIKEVGGYHMQ